MFLMLCIRILILFSLKTSRPSFSLESHDMGRYYKLPPKFDVEQDKANSPLSARIKKNRDFFLREFFPRKEFFAESER